MQTEAPNMMYIYDLDRLTNMYHSSSEVSHNYERGDVVVVAIPVS